MRRALHIKLINYLTNRLLIEGILYQISHPHNTTDRFWTCGYNLREYSGPPLMRPPFGNEEFGHIKGVATCEGGIRRIITDCVPQICAFIRGRY